MTPADGVAWPGAPSRPAVSPVMRLPRSMRTRGPAQCTGLPAGPAPSSPTIARTVPRQAETGRIPCRRVWFRDPGLSSGCLRRSPRPKGPNHFAKPYPHTRSRRLAARQVSGCLHQIYCVGSDPHIPLVDTEPPGACPSRGTKRHMTATLTKETACQEKSTGIGVGSS